MPKNWSYRGAVRTFCVTRRPCCLAPFGIVGCPSLTQSRDRFIGASIKVNISIDSGLRSSVETLPPQSYSLACIANYDPVTMGPSPDQPPDHVLVLLSSSWDPRVQAFESSKYPLKLVRWRRFANNREGFARLSAPAILTNPPKYETFKRAAFRSAVRMLRGFHNLAAYWRGRTR
jgi:hypothetical protein